MKNNKTTKQREIKGWAVVSKASNNIIYSFNSRKFWIYKNKRQAIEKIKHTCTYKIVKIKLEE